MKAFTNIEKSAFRRGEYIGYADGPWRVMRSKFYLGAKPVRWTAIHLGRKHSTLYGQTLTEISKQLSEILP